MSRRVLICGMSGTGKSTVAAELVARGHRAVDVDHGFVIPTADGRQLWDEPRIEGLLDEPAELLFVLGLEENGVRFLPRFDAVVLLTAPVAVLVSGSPPGPPTRSERTPPSWRGSSTTCARSSRCSAAPRPMRSTPPGRWTRW